MVEDCQTITAARWFNRPILWLTIAVIVLVSSVAAVWRGITIGVRAMDDAGAYAYWDVQRWSIWVEEHFSIHHNDWAWDGNVTEVRAGGEDFHDEHLQQLSRFPRLRELRLLKVGITDAGLRSLLDAGGLKKLNGLIISECEQISGTAVSDLDVLPELERLICNVPDLSGEDLQGFLRLKILRADSADLRNSDFRVIAQLPRIERIFLVDSMIDDEGLQALEHCSRLTHLSLNGSQVTSAGVEVIAQYCPELESLSLARTAVTDECLLYIVKLSALRRVDFTGTAVTPTAIERLQAKCPDLRVHHLE